MKTLIILTDFSKNARNAANAALEIAVKLNSKLLLVNSYLMPVAVVSAESEGRGMIDTSLITSASTSGLKKEARRLKALLNKMTVTIRKPEVGYLATMDSIHDVVKILSEKLQISMMVIGAHETSLPRLFSEINLQALLGQLSYPLVIIPKNHRDFAIKNVVFATDLDEEDLSMLRKIDNCGRTFGFHLHVCHVSSTPFVPDFNEEDKVAWFQHHVALLGQGNITFTNLKGRSLAKAMNNFNASIGADLLAIIYHPHSLAWKLLHENHSAKLIRNQKLPLLIFPPNFLEICNE